MGSSDHITFWSFLVFDQFPEINAFLRTIFNNIFLLSLFLAFALTQWKETNNSFFLFSSFKSFVCLLLHYFKTYHLRLALDKVLPCVWESAEMAAFCVFSLLLLMSLCIEVFMHFCFVFVFMSVFVFVFLITHSFLVSSFLLLPAASKARPLFHQLVENNHHGSVFL